VTYIERLRAMGDRGVAEQAVRDATVRAKILRARFIARYGYDPIARRKKKSPDVVTRRGGDSIHLADRVRIDIYVRDDDR
jgi:hypothetical protein